MVSPLGQTDLETRVARLEAAMEEVLRRQEAQQEGAEPKAAEASGGIRPSASAHTVELESCVEEEIEEEGHEVKPCIWDAAVFIGLPGLRRSQSCVLVVLLVINAVGQLCLAMTVGFVPNNFINNSLPSIEDLRSFRVAEAHALERMYGGVSLAHRVCQTDSSLSVAGPQVAAVQAQQAYLERSWVFGLPSGSVLCAFALLLWWLVVFGELVEILNFALGVAAVPRERATRLVRTPEGAFALRSLSFRRFTGLLLLVLLRTLIAVMLLVLGSIWLATTANLESMVLNAAALSFVMDLDDLLFQAFGPPRAKALISKMEHFPSPKIRIRRALVLGVIVVALLAWLVPTKMWDMAQTLNSMNDTLCGGDQDFVYTTNAAMGFVQIAPTLRSTDKSAYAASVEKAVREHTYREKPNDKDMSLVNYTLMDLISEQDFTASQIVAHIDCQDQPTLFANFLATVRAVLSDDAIASCADVRDKCEKEVLVRALCPGTCGCLAPRGLKFRKGCPPACVVSEEYRQALQAINCTDMTPEQILAEPGGLNLKEQFKHVECNRTTPNQCLPPSEMVYGSFLYYCPHACGCVGAAGLRGCPPACA